MENQQGITFRNKRKVVFFGSFDFDAEWDRKDRGGRFVCPMITLVARCGQNTLNVLPCVKARRGDNHESAASKHPVVNT